MKYVKYIWIIIFMLSMPTIAAAHQIPKDAEEFIQSEKCSTCHEEIYNEWKKSYHSKSSALVDKAHLSVSQAFSKALEDSGKDGNYHCGSCHTPMASNLKELMSGDAKLDSKDWTQSEGVGCTFCHRVETIVHMTKFNQYRINKDNAFGVSYNPANTPHQIVTSAIYGNGDLCLGCHSHNINSNGTPICIMKEEGTENCLKCHMQRVEGARAKGSKTKSHLSHLMSGAHNLDMLRDAVNMDSTLNTKDGKNILEITITNIINHSFPSTNPLRIAYLKIKVIDKSGHVTWTNFTKSPMEDKQAVFFKAFKNQDKVGVPSWDATEVAFDSRLKAKEIRTFNYSIIPETDGKITIELIYRLFPPDALDTLKIPRDGVNDIDYIVHKEEIGL
ncbi:MAG: hypothetical protein HQK91_02095 [Nitrospirae bacterium]|nr:hypothetical protein [Nitrospirota bacterium]